jgi:phosphatidylserine synthase
MKKEIPNLLTLGNLLAGCLGLWFVMQGDLVSASYCIFISLVCDFFDGFLARALQAYSDLGKELDSLADMVSFGVLPAFILFSLVEQSCGSQCTVGLFGFYKPFMVFALALMSAYRLAKRSIHRCPYPSKRPFNCFFTLDSTFSTRIQFLYSTFSRPIDLCCVDELFIGVRIASFSL